MAQAAWRNARAPDSASGQRDSRSTISHEPVSSRPRLTRAGNGPGGCTRVEPPRYGRRATRPARPLNPAGGSPAGHRQWKAIASVVQDHPIEPGSGRPVACACAPRCRNAFSSSAGDSGPAAGRGCLIAADVHRRMTDPVAQRTRPDLRSPARSQPGQDDGGRCGSQPPDQRPGRISGRRGPTGAHCGGGHVGGDDGRGCGRRLSGRRRRDDGRVEVDVRHRTTRRARVLGHGAHSGGPRRDHQLPADIDHVRVVDAFGIGAIDPRPAGRVAEVRVGQRAEGVALLHGDCARDLPLGMRARRR